MSWKTSVRNNDRSVAELSFAAELPFFAEAVQLLIFVLTYTHDDKIPPTKKPGALCR